MDDTCWEVYGSYLKQRRDAGVSLKEIGDEVTYQAMDTQNIG